MNSVPICDISYRVDDVALEFSEGGAISSLHQTNDSFEGLTPQGMHAGIPDRLHLWNFLPASKIAFASGVPIMARVRGRPDAGLVRFSPAEPALLLQQST